MPGSKVLVPARPMPRTVVPELFEELGAHVPALTGASVSPLYTLQPKMNMSANPCFIAAFMRSVHQSKLRRINMMTPQARKTARDC